MHKEIKGIVNSGNVCQHLAQNLLSSLLLPMNVHIKICKVCLLFLFYVGVKLDHSH